MQAVVKAGFIMETHEVISGLLSTDRRTVVEASWAIIHAEDEQILNLASKQVADISASVKELPPDTKPSFRDYRFAPQLAVAVLECFNNPNVCRCSLYVASNCLDPDIEQQLGYVEVLGVDDFPDEYRTDYTCVCAKCRTPFTVVFEESYHYPLWYWRQI